MAISDHYNMSWICHITIFVSDLLRKYIIVIEKMYLILFCLLGYLPCEGDLNITKKNHNDDSTASIPGRIREQAFMLITKDCWCAHVPLNGCSVLCSPAPSGRIRFLFMLTGRFRVPWWLACRLVDWSTF